jgi:hypothetical protein
MERVAEVLASAFSPLTCDVTVTDRSIGFSVFDRGRAVLSVLYKPADHLREPVILRARIEEIRLELASEGHRLNPWAAPA